MLFCIALYCIVLYCIVLSYKERPYRARRLALNPTLLLTSFQSNSHVVPPWLWFQHSNKCYLPHLIYSWYFSSPVKERRYLILTALFGVHPSFAPLPCFSLWEKHDRHFTSFSRGILIAAFWLAEATGWLAGRNFSLTPSFKVSFSVPRCLVAAQKARSVAAMFGTQAKTCSNRTKDRRIPNKTFKIYYGPHSLVTRGTSYKQTSKLLSS